MRYSLLFLSLLPLLGACSQDNPVSQAPSTLHDANTEFAFTLTIENLTNTSASPQTLKPLAWALMPKGQSLFQANQAPGILSAVFKAGDPTPLLNAATQALAKGQTPSDIAPGSKFELKFKAKPGATLSFASVIKEQKDLFIGLKAPLALFDAQNEPVAEQNLALTVWDAGLDESPQNVIRPVESSILNISQDIQIRLSSDHLEHDDEHDH